MVDIPINRAGAPVNTPQHIFDNGTGITEGHPESRAAKEVSQSRKGENVSPDPATETRDPHPSDEEHPYRERHPGGSYPPKVDIGPNPAAHNGTAPRRPHNAGSGPE